MANAAIIALEIQANGTAKVINNINSVHNAMNKLDTKSVAAGATIGTILGNAINKGAEKLFEFGKETLDYADQMGDMISKSGMGAEAFQEFAYAAKVGGSSIEAVQAGIKEMQKSLTDGDKILSDFGVNFEELKKQSPEEQFRALLTQLNAIQDPAEKTRFAMAAFKDTSLINMASEFESAAEEAKNLGVIMNDGAIKAAQDFNDKMDTVKMQLQAAFVNALPYVEEWGLKTYAAAKYAFTLFWDGGKQLFENLFTNMFLIPDNMGIIINWIENNWENVWDNMGKVVIDVGEFMGKTISDIFFAVINGIGDKFKGLWDGITTGDLGKIADAMNPFNVVADAIVAAENNFNSLTDKLAKDTGVKLPELLGVKITEGLGEIADSATKEFNDAWLSAEKTKAARDSFKYNADVKPGDVVKNSNQTLKENAALALRGSNDAYKTISAFRNQENANLEKKQLEETKKQTDILSGIRDAVSGKTTQEYAIA